MVKPVIMIKPQELTNTLQLLEMAPLADLAPKGDTDPLAIILKELGQAENYNDETRDIQLTLINRFPKLDGTPVELFYDKFAQK